MNDTPTLTHTHTDSCRERTRQLLNAREVYDLQYPGHCARCGGTGYLQGGDWVPYGSTNAWLPSEDPCTCLEHGRCPRCGRVVWDEDDCEELTCPACGWQEGKTDPRPELDECGCYEQYVYDVLDRMYPDRF